MATTQQPRTDFVKALSRLDATALVVGSMIGSGIFIVSADILRQVHAPGVLLLVWTLSGVVTLMGALSYGELAAMFPRAGGQYVYLREGISPLFGYLYGWTLFLVIQTGTIAAVAVAFARFTAVFFPSLSPDVFLGTTVNLGSGPIQVGLSPQRLVAILSVVVLTWINVRGVKIAAIIQTSLTAIKTTALAALILLGITIGRNVAAMEANFGPAFWPAGGLAAALWPVIGAAMVGSLFSMDAWNNVGFAGSELKDAKRDLPIAMAAGTLIVTALWSNNVTPFLRWSSGDLVTYSEADDGAGPYSVFPRLKHAHRTSGFFKVRGINLGHQDLEDFMFRHLEIGDFRAEALNEGGNDFLRLSIEVRLGADGAGVGRALSAQLREKFELLPQVVVLETGTLAKEFEANVKAARFIDRR